MTIRGRNSLGDRLAYAGPVSAYAIGDEGSFSLCIHEDDTQSTMHVIDNTGVDVCSSARATENSRR